ncbi:MAG: carboxypeptidase regulatory-like domain-containing protein [Planctomycetia bacterium]|nr:carboxypeptidase regulatory-like domain-containing protein [Planctomycetia bacterium]
MKNLLFTLTTLTITIFAIGCSGQKRPEGMPSLVPVSVCVTQEGTPVVDAVVSLIPDDPALKKWSPGGRTNESGIVELRTLGFKGAAVGTYKVTIQKTEIESETTGTGPLAQTKAKYFNCVDLKYGNETKTPLTLNVTEKNERQTFDVGQAMREEFRPKMK